MKTRFQKLLAASAALVWLSTINFPLSTAFAQGTAFAYQGQLDSDGTPANGSFDLTFALFTASSGGNPTAGPLTNFATGISNGLFAVTLDFGPGVFTGTNFWIEIGVRTNGGGSFTTLAPRQQLLPTPYAIFANTSSNLSGTLSAGQLSGTVKNNQLANSSLTISAGTGLSGGGAVALGGSTTLNNAGVTSLTGNADITASPATGAVTLGDTATSANTASRIVKRDGSGNFSAGSVTLAGNVNLPATTASTGIIFSGANTLLHTFGNANTFLGVGAGNLTTSGSGGNTGIGYEALQDNTTGVANTAIGQNAFANNTTGSADVAVGFFALWQNTNGMNNTALGFQTLVYNSSGNYNTASGSSAMQQNTTGSQNAASGYDALYSNTNGGQNTAFGCQAMQYNTSGSDNTAVGAFALGYLGFNTPGFGGVNNIAMGDDAGGAFTADESNNIDIGNSGAEGESGTIRIGTTSVQTNAFIAGIYGSTSASGVPVYVNSSGQLGTLTSSRQFKENIQRMADASDVLYALQPVTFRYKPGIDPQGTPQFGLVAEDVDKVAPELVVRDPEHGIYTVRYEAVDAMLLNEFLKEHRTVEEQQTAIQGLNQKSEAGIQKAESEIDELRTENAELKERLEKLEQRLGH